MATGKPDLLDAIQAAESLNDEVEGTLNGWNYWANIKGGLVNVWFYEEGKDGEDTYRRFELDVT